MVAGDDDVVFVGVRAWNDADNVPDDAALVVLLEMHVDVTAGGAAEMIGEVQRPASRARGSVGR